jgi:hypothetical protein
MNDRPDDTEARLRAALAGRADAVEPAAGGNVVVDRMAAATDAARRRRTLLSVAAGVLVVALLAGAFALLGDDDADTDVATAGSTSTTVATTTSAPAISASDAPVIWPLPTMSVSYAEAADAAEAFGTNYLGITSECSRDVDPDDGVVLLIPSTEGCSVEGEPHPQSIFTTVAVERRAQGWAVTGAESSSLQVTPAAGAVVGADIEVTVVGPQADVAVTASVPPLGQDPNLSPSVDEATIPRDADGTWRPVLGAADGPTVLIVSWGISATARVFTVDDAGATVDPESGPGADDQVPGWPGAVARRFDDPESAAIAFVTDVLGFFEPTLQGSAATDDIETEVTLTSNAQSTATTTVLVHDTGDARGWVVVDVTASNGTIDGAQVVPDPDGVFDVSVTGTASAFEAAVDVRVLDLEGNVLGEGTTLAGANGEVGPYDATVHLDVPGNPFFVQIAEGDASGRGRFTWGVVRRLAN